MTTTHPIPDMSVDRKEIDFEVFGRYLSDHIGEDRVRRQRCLVGEEMARTGEIVVGQKVVDCLIVTIGQFEFGFVRIVLG